MAPSKECCLRGTLLGLLLIAESSMGAGVASDLECQDLHCDRTDNIYMAEQELVDSELYLLQRKAQMIKKTSAPLARDGLSFATKKTSVAKMCSLHPQHSRASAFVTAVRSRVPDVSHKQRLAMLSTVEASQLGEKGTKATIGACCLVLMLTIVFFVVMAVMESKFGQIFGEFVQQGVEILANDIFGLDVTFGSMIVGVFRGSIMITDLKIANPPNWNGDSFLTANAMDVKLNLWSYAWQRCFGKSINLEVDSVTLKDVNLNVEKSPVSSNIQDILDTVHGRIEKPKREPPTTKSSKVRVQSEKECKLTLRKMTIVDACATVPFWGHVTVPSVQCKDFDKATEGKAKAIRPIVAEILREFCQTGEWASEFMVKPQHENQASEEPIQIT